LDSEILFPIVVQAFLRNYIITFGDLAENHREDKFRPEFKTFGERDKALKILQALTKMLGLDLRAFVVKLSRCRRYALHPCQRTPCTHTET
jgi:hypothetical protein